MNKDTKNSLSITITIFVFGLVILLVFWVAGALSQNIYCSNYKTQSDAQKAYDSDKNLYHSLDGYDKDGVVCEHLSK